MNRSSLSTALLACSLVFGAVQGIAPGEAKAASQSAGFRLTYQLPPHPEKVLFLNTEMVTIENPQPAELVAKHRLDSYLSDQAGGYISEKAIYWENLTFLTSKKGFLLDVYNWIGVLPPVYPAGYDPAEMDRRVAATELFTEEGMRLHRERGEINLQARLQALINAGYVKPEEIDDGAASKYFVATVLYRMFKDVRPYHGGIDLKDSQDIPVRWAVEIGLPGFDVAPDGYVYPQNRLQMTPGPKDVFEEYPYKRLFDFLTLILPGKKTANGWEYYQVKLKPGMVPVRMSDLMYVNGQPMSPYTVYDHPAYYDASKKIARYVTPRFEQMLKAARADALKPRVWDWSRDLIHHPRFAQLVADYRKTRSSRAVNAVYQAVRTHYNLNVRQDSPAVIKSVLDHVK
ncbi:hypothetical protein A6764_21955 [Brevibacillus sp. WF146]|uniref:hypothetical protein n=1 Tax=Brevibacillus sp. WF146 TaxID=319501 RepID=UPI0007ECE5C0|nr:hypothetical protein [Brevibacillus sp. WF146]UYZ13384.1 hypothetical protein A6764_21955 [Brevibacillus sp. WF146]